MDTAPVENTAPGLRLRRRSASGAADPALIAPLSTARRASAAIRSITSTDPNLRALKEVGTQIRAKTSAALPNSVFDLKRSLERRGFAVHFGANASEAREVIVGIASAHGVESVVKSKSMATEEIGLDRALRSAGIQVTETDLGDFIVQLAGERPAHILTPAINKTASAVARLFIDSGVATPEEVDADRPDKRVLTALARRYLRSEFLRADMGITGANFACAQEGVLVGISNEGNLRMCVSLPRIHVAVVPIEKIVRSLEDVAVLLPLLTATATGQPLTSYVSLIAGPRRDGEADGPEESHVILLDNGRGKIPATRYESILRCVRCGACLNACPVYTTMGGHAYGTTYMGPVGAVLATLIEESGLSELPYASSLCGACTEICPVSIPLHDLLYELRSDPRHSHQSLALRAAFSAWSGIWRRPLGFRASKRVVALSARVGELLRLGEIVADPDSTRRFVAAANPVGRAVRRALRRTAVPIPQAARVPDTPHIDTGRASANRAGLGSSEPVLEVHAAQSPSSRTPPSSRGLRPTLRTRPVAGSLPDAFLSSLARNGIGASRVPEEILSRALIDLLQDVHSAAVDDALLAGEYRPQVERALEDRAIRTVDVSTDGASKAEVGIASPFAGIAQTGSLLFRFAPGTPRLTSLLPPYLVAVLPAERVVGDLSAAFASLNDAGIPSGAALVSGPSKTGDIELTLVNGVHGPGKVSVLVVE